MLFTCLEGRWNICHCEEGICKTAAALSALRPTTLFHKNCSLIESFNFHYMVPNWVKKRMQDWFWLSLASSASSWESITFVLNESITFLIFSQFCYDNIFFLVFKKVYLVLCSLFDSFLPDIHYFIHLLTSHLCSSIAFSSIYHRTIQGTIANVPQACIQNSSSLLCSPFLIIYSLQYLENFCI